MHLVPGTFFLLSSVILHSMRSRRWRQSLGASAKAPFTSIVFMFELSHNPNALLPLVVCVMISDGFVRIFSRDSIMTIKLVKRGLIVLQDYSVPVLMRARIDQVMRKQFNVMRGEDELIKVLETFVPGETLIPIVDSDEKLIRDRRTS